LKEKDRKIVSIQNTSNKTSLLEGGDKNRGRMVGGKSEKKYIESGEISPPLGGKN